MRIIHCADLHLESPLKNLLDESKAKDRRDEILDNFSRLVDYAENNDVSVIIFAGDTFDRESTRKTPIRRIFEQISEHESINFVFLKGNHDKRGVFEGEYEIPDNVTLIQGPEWTKYESGNVVIKGVELTEDNYKDIAHSLVLDPGKCNIVTLHCGAANHKGEKKVYEINFNDLKNKHIDYLALGHIHKYIREQLDDRGVFVYPGCLEGRGFDEAGDKGFVLLDIDEEGKIIDTFVPFANRIIYRLEVEVTPNDSMRDIIDKISDVTLDIKNKDLVEIILVGKTNMDDLVDIDVRRIKREFSDHFYFFRVKDHTTVEVDYASFANDRSLKGEFVRLLERQSDVSDEDKSIIVELGIKALRGENLDI